MHLHVSSITFGACVTRNLQEHFASEPYVVAPVSVTQPSSAHQAKEAKHCGYGEEWYVLYNLVCRPACLTVADCFRERRRLAQGHERSRENQVSCQKDPGKSSSQDIVNHRNLLHIKQHPDILRWRIRPAAIIMFGSVPAPGHQGLHASTLGAGSTSFDSIRPTGFNSGCWTSEGTSFL